MAHSQSRQLTWVKILKAHAIPTWPIPTMVTLFPEVAIGSAISFISLAFTDILIGFLEENFQNHTQVTLKVKIQNSVTLEICHPRVLSESFNLHLKFHIGNQKIENTHTYFIDCGSLKV